MEQKFVRTAGEDLGSDVVYKAVAVDDGKPAANGREAGGLLTHIGNSGENVPLMFMGFGRFKAGAAITKGQRLTVTASGWLIAATSGSYVIGRCAEADVTSGSTGQGFFNFATPAYMGDSGESA